MKRNYYLAISLTLMTISCSSITDIMGGDPYANSSGKKTTVTSSGKGVTSKTTTNRSKSSGAGVIDDSFDETDQKIVDFIAQKVYENKSQIKQVTVDSLNKLLTEKNIRMSKREFLARTYQVINENKMNSFYLAAGRVLNQLK